MPAEHPAVHVDDLARLRRLRPNRLHHARVIAVRHEADVLAVRLGRDRQAEIGGDLADQGLGQAAEREAQIIELLAGGGEQEIALVARRIGGAVQLRPVRPDHPPHIMAGGEAIGAEIAGEAQQVGELHPLVARDAGDRRAAARIFVGEALDHAVAEAAFIIEDVMGDAEPLGDRARVVNVAAGAAALRPTDRRAMIVELKRDSDHLGAGAGGERGHDRAVDAAGHGDDDPRLAGGAGKLEIGLEHGAHIGACGQKSHPDGALTTS